MVDRTGRGRSSDRSSPTSNRSRIEALSVNLRIDRDDLDGCLIGQPDHFYRVAEACAKVRADLDTAKLRLDEVHANQDREIRRDAEQAGEKITESRIQQEVKLDPKYKAAKEHIQELAAELEALLALKEAFQQRSFMLRELVSLVVAERSDQAGATGAYEGRNRRAEEARSMRPQRGRPRATSGD